MWRAIKLNDTNFFIFNYSSSEECWDPVDVPESSMIVHAVNLIHATDNSYGIDQKVTAADQVKQLNASTLYYVHHHVP